MRHSKRAHLPGVAAQHRAVTDAHKAEWRVERDDPVVPRHRHSVEVPFQFDHGTYPTLFLADQAHLLEVRLQPGDVVVVGQEIEYLLRRRVYVCG